MASATGPVVAIVPAAGRSERFGGLKAIARIAGVPMLARVLATLRAAGVADLVVVLGEEAALIGEHVDLGGCRVVTNPQPERGMFSSLQVGFAAAIPGATYVVAVGDMPFVLPQTVRALLDEHARVGGIVTPNRGGKRGHPIVADDALRAAVLAAEPVPGFTLHDVIRAQAERRHDLAVADPGVLRDVDTITDLEQVKG